MSTADHEVRLDPATLETIDRWLRYRVWHSRVPGAQVAIGLRGEVVFSAAYGWADVERRVPMSLDHLFRIASHSKNLTATLVLQLVEQERLGLEDPIGDHVPELADSDLGRIVIRELLEHTSGVLRDGVDGQFWQGERPFPDRAELVRLVSAGAKKAPGELFAYSNLAYGLVGLAIEAVTGLPYAEVVRTRISDPLGLADTYGDYRPDRAADYATGYSGLSVGVRRAPIPHVDTAALDAATGVTSTAKDLVTYFSAHALGAPQLIGDRSKRLMQRAANPVDPEDADAGTYGLGTAGETVNDRRIVGHGGGYPGHITQTRLDAATGLVVTVLTNAIDGPAGALATGVLKLVDAATDHPGDVAPDEATQGLLGRWANVWGVFDVGILGGRILGLHPESDDPVKGADVLEVDGPGRLRVASGNGYSSVGETIEQEDGGRLRYCAFRVDRFDELPERADALT